MKRLLKCGAALLFLAMLVPLFRPVAGEASEILQQLKQPGVHAIMRHAIAPGTGDPANFALGDCDTQRNLDDRGRTQARAIGDELKRAGIAFDRVLTSQWCRCRETAQLLDLGETGDFPALNSFFRDRSKAEGQTQALRAFLTSVPGDETVMLVTHQVNITALTGEVPASGEIFLIRINDAGEAEIVGEFLARP